MILSTAMSHIQSKGYNGFSYRTIAERIGIKTASIHYYFPRKSDLGKFLMVDYKSRFKDELHHIDRDIDDAPMKLQQFTNLFIQTLARGNRMCLCGMLAIDIVTLPPEIVEEVMGFIRDIEQWLTHVLTRGREAGSLKFDGPPEDQAKVMFAVLEGGMMTARILNDSHHFEQVIRQFLATLNSSTGR